MDEAEFQSQIDSLPRGMRFMVAHVIQMSTGVIVLFGALFIVTLFTHEKARTDIAVFCIVAIAMAAGNMFLFTRARKRLMGPRTD